MYQCFVQEMVPEAIDLNALPVFRNQGISASLLNNCETMAVTKSDEVGIGGGLYSDYGAAQRHDVKREYVPDCQGAMV